MLIYLNNRQAAAGGHQAKIADLIYSDDFGESAFNLDVDERVPVMDSLLKGTVPELHGGESESIRNIIGRYSDIVELFPPEIDDHALPYFIYWLIGNVDLVQITAYSDDDAYTIFETMNDRGLSLSPTEMLKGFLLTNITNPVDRTAANELWKERIDVFREIGSDEDADFLKNWLRSQYAMKIRERKKGAKPEDFDQIGTEFHRWVRKHADEKGDDPLVLRGSNDFYRFITSDFKFYSRQYIEIIAASVEMKERVPEIFFNAWLGLHCRTCYCCRP